MAKTRRPVRRKHAHPRRKKPAVSWWKTQPPGQRFHDKAGDVVCGDALELLKSLRSNIADIVFLDPPFNLGKVYGARGRRQDLQPDGSYLAFITSILEESARILRSGGSLYLYHIPRWAVRLAPVLEKHLRFCHWIAISMKNGYPRRKGLYPAHYALLHYTRGTPSVLRRPTVPPPACPHCDEYIRDYGGYREHVENGINLSDVWDDLSPVRHRKYKLRDANELPLAIPKRAVEMSGRRTGLLVDPFAGTGSAIVLARLKGMKAIAGDSEMGNCKLILQRMAAIRKRKRPKSSAMP
jgi:site-specific DNA-methyltransferase (adenine-specific)